MIQQYEHAYAKLVHDVLYLGEDRAVRNGKARSLFGLQLRFSCRNDSVPLLQGRRMYPQGVLGEFAAMIRGPKHVDDFKKWGCNYWELWADEEGNLELDYGNAWNIEETVELLKTDPTNRRILIDAWRPDRLSSLSLPCCHYSYQFYVRDGVFVDMLWTQRSVDMMIGLPSDMLFAALWLKLMANEVGLKAGEVVMSLGDCHIYEEHLIGAREYLNAVNCIGALWAPMMKLHVEQGMPQKEFEPSMADISYESLPPIKFELKS